MHKWSHQRLFLLTSNFRRVDFLVQMKRHIRDQTKLYHHFLLIQHFQIHLYCLLYLFYYCIFCHRIAIVCYYKSKLCFDLLIVLVEIHMNNLFTSYFHHLFTINHLNINLIVFRPKYINYYFIQKLKDHIFLQT